MMGVAVNWARAYRRANLVLRIVCGLVVGVLLACAVPGWSVIGLPGRLFVGALQAIAPILVALLVTSSLASGQAGLSRKFGLVIGLYLVATFLAAVIAVSGSFLFPQTLVLQTAAEARESVSSAPLRLAEVIMNLFAKVTENPLSAMAKANYLGVLFWSVFAGLVMNRAVGPRFKAGLSTLSDVVLGMVRMVIECAPLGIMGLVFTAVSENGLDIFKVYGSLVALLVGCMAFVALVMNPAIMFAVTRRNPYPLVLACLQRSGVTAFFTRSSAANIPVNMQLCKDLGLNQDIYAVSIPLGATVNMSGSAVTISVMTLAAANTMGIHPDIGSAILLSLLAALAACGASGVPGGSILLIPMACSLFGMGIDVAEKVVGVGFVIGVVQDSVETMLNSSSDVMFAATAEYSRRSGDLWEKRKKCGK